MIVWGIKLSSHAKIVTTFLFIGLLFAALSGCDSNVLWSMESEAFTDRPVREFHGFAPQMTGAEFKAFAEESGAIRTFTDIYDDREVHSAEFSRCIERPRLMPHLCILYSEPSLKFGNAGVQYISLSIDPSNEKWISHKSTRSISIHAWSEHFVEFEQHVLASLGNPTIEKTYTMHSVGDDSEFLGWNWAGGRGVTMLQKNFMESDTLHRSIILRIVMADDS